jgi:tetratricopeptide (TPR) repeat protein
MVLSQTNRQHEVPGLWKEQLERRPQDGQAFAKYAIALLQAGREAEGIQAFEDALKQLEDATLVKRYYAPVLSEKGDLDRAMDFFEDCLDAAPTDVSLLLEYAQTLKKAGRDFEIPKVLRDALACNPDPNTRANVLAWLIELEQPKRAEAIEQARLKMDEQDFAGAASLVKPLRNWLADYWKMWFLLAAASNRMSAGALSEEDRTTFATDAEDACRRLIELFPGFEPAYAEVTQALHTLGRDEEAYDLLRFMAPRMPQSLTVHVHLALAAYRAGHREEAVQLKRQIREAVGQNEEVERGLEEIQD